MTPLERPSLARITADLLQGAIESGEYGHFLPGLRPLSRKVQVSIPVLSNAIYLLQEQGLVQTAPGKRTRILSQHRKNKTTEEPQTIIFLTFTRNWIAGYSHYQAVIDELQGRKFAVQVIEIRDASLEQQLVEINGVLEQIRAACWVLIGAPAEIQRVFASQRLPCILDGIAAPGVALPDFEVDFEALYRHAVRHLQNLGHRRIVLLAAAHSERINPRSFEVFRSVVRSRIPKGERWEPVRTFDGSPEETRTVLERLFLTGQPRPTALMVTSVNRVASTMTWLMQHGFRIPEDVSIISRDYEEILEYLHPLPTVYCQPPTAPRRFVRGILKSLERKQPHRQIRLIPSFRDGKSTAPSSE